MTTILLKKTTLFKYVITKDHRVNWDHSKILTFETDYTKPRFLELFFIYNSEIATSDKENCFCSEIYDDLAKSTTSCYSLTFCFGFFFRLRSPLYIASLVLLFIISPDKK